MTNNTEETGEHIDPSQRWIGNVPVNADGIDKSRLPFFSPSNFEHDAYYLIGHKKISKCSVLYIPPIDTVEYQDRPMFFSFGALRSLSDDELAQHGRAILEHARLQRLQKEGRNRGV